MRVDFTLIDGITGLSFVANTILVDFGWFNTLSYGHLQHTDGHCTTHKIMAHIASKRFNFYNHPSHLLLSAATHTINRHYIRIGTKNSCVKVADERSSSLARRRMILYGSFPTCVSYVTSCLSRLWLLAGIRYLSCIEWQQIHEDLCSVLESFLSVL